MISVKDVSFFRHRTQILHDISIDIDRGGVTALIGPNGAGKSTLLGLVARLLPLVSGTITVEGLPVNRTPGRDLAKTIAIMRQDTAIASRLRVRELVGFGRFPHHRGRPGDADLAYVDEALEIFDLMSISERYLDTLSGGQRQRALVAMAFAQGTDYLLLDEPLNNLDIFYARELMHRLTHVAREKNRTVIVVLHDINQAAAHADRIIAMKDGRIVASGSPGEVVTTEMLDVIFGYEMPVATVDGRPIAMHFL